MDFMVLSRKGIKDLHTDKKHIIISVMDPEDSEGPAKIPENKKNIGILTLAFHDWNGKQMRLIKKSNSPQAENYIYFNQKMAKQIVDFVRNFIVWDLELIICQCEAGISRSAGIAAALAYCITGDDKRFFEMFLPNTLVYGLIMQEWNRNA